MVGCRGQPTHPNFSCDFVNANFCFFFAVKHGKIYTHYMHFQSKFTSGNVFAASAALDPAGGASSSPQKLPALTPPDPIAGGEGGSLPPSQEPTPLSAFSLDFRPSVFPSQLQFLDTPMIYTVDTLYQYASCSYGHHPSHVSPVRQ